MYNKKVNRKKWCQLEKQLTPFFRLLRRYKSLPLGRNFCIILYYTVLQTNTCASEFPMSITSIRLNDDIEKPLDNLAAKLDRSKNYLINQAIKEFVARQSMEESRWNDTLKALDSVKNGNLIGENDVNAWLNSWGTNNETVAPHK